MSILLTVIWGIIALTIRWFVYNYHPVNEGVFNFFDEDMDEPIIISMILLWPAVLSIIILALALGYISSKFDRE